MEKEKNNSGVIIFIIILIFLVLGLGGFIIYDKFLSNNINDNDNTLNENIVYSTGTTTYYYNPITDSKCNKGEANCYGWYILTTNDSSTNTTIEVILNQNLGSTIAWNENWKSNEDTSDGAVTALNYLYEQTNSWNVIPRMLTLNDVANILNTTLNEEGHLGVVEVPNWLYSNGDTLETWNGGYWLEDEFWIIDASRGLISKGDQFKKSLPTYYEYWGIRPIIEINKDKLK